jgi:sugar/nucleoside kinase (ribokinase family)
MGKVLGAVVAGHICLDIIPEIQTTPPNGFNETFLPGHLLEVGAAAFCTGGAVSNTGLALHHLGIPLQLISKVGADVFGRIVLEPIESYDPGLATGIVVDPQAATSYSIVISPSDVDRIILHNPAANYTFSADDIDYHLVGRAALYHFGYPPIVRRMYVRDGQGLLEGLPARRPGAWCAGCSSGGRGQNRPLPSQPQPCRRLPEGMIHA